MSKVQTGRRGGDIRVNPQVSGKKREGYTKPIIETIDHMAER